MSDLYLFKTSSGVSLIGTEEGFRKHWLAYIIERGETFTAEPYMGTASL